MARPYSQDLRDRVISLCLADTSARQAAARYDIATATAIRWVRLARETGWRVPIPRTPPHHSMLDPYQDAITAMVMTQPGMTLAVLQKHILEDFGVRASIATIWTCLRRYGLKERKDNRG